MQLTNNRSKEDSCQQMMIPVPQSVASNRVVVQWIAMFPLESPSNPGFCQGSMFLSSNRSQGSIAERNTYTTH